MNKLNHIKSALLAITLALSATVTACGKNDVTVEVPETYAKLMEISDYGLGDKDDGYKDKTKMRTAASPMSLPKNSTTRSCLSSHPASRRV